MEAEYVMVRDEDHPVIIEHLRKTFFVDEPLNKVVGLAPHGEGHERLEKNCCATLAEGYSIACVENGEIIGVALNGIIRNGDVKEALNNLKNVNDEKYRKIFSLLYNVTESLDLFNKYGVDEIFECRIVSVDPKTRGRGIANELVKRSVDLAKSQGFKIVKGEATGIFSQRICLKNGMKVIHEINYKDYVDKETGLHEFETVEPPHLALKVLIVELY